MFWFPYLSLYHEFSGLAMSKQNVFANRIIGYGTKSADQFMANELNWRTHPQRQRDAVQASLRELGWIGVVVENKTTGKLIDGHERVWQALKQNEDVPYIEVELSEAEERLALAVFDPITAMAETDSDILDALLREVNTGEDALQALLADMAEDAGLYQDKKDVDAPAQVDRAEELRQQWGTATGQLWQLGEHRLIVGDSTDKDVVARVMGGEKAACMWTDPPYGVSYVGKTKDALTIENDGSEGLLDLLIAAFGASDKTALADGASFYIAAPAGPQFYDFATALIETGWKWHETLVWLKNSMVLGHSDYHYKHEAVFYGWKGKNRHWYAGRDQVSVFEVDRPSRSEEHPTMKPPELVVAMLENSTKPADVVYEPFSGSGTTIIACEQLGRKCRAAEISPGYVAVALQRWADATGQTPVLVE
jgi:site-specific DNA-methyltransferase (adenine-specific)